MDKIEQRPLQDAIALRSVTASNAPFHLMNMFTLLSFRTAQHVAGALLSVRAAHAVITFHQKEVLMLPTIKKILYATDLSKNSRLAFGYAASLTQQFGAQLLVLHAIEPVNPNTYSHIGGMMGEAEWINLQVDFENKIVDDLGAKLREFCSYLQTTVEDIKINDEHLLIRKGMSVDIIMEVAKEMDADLIVMGTHGYGMVKDALMGGTARRIVRRSEIPVMVVRSKDID